MAAQQPSPEELQEYLEQLRSADAAEVVAQAFQILAMGAEVKLGRPDARVLIDALGAVVDAVGGRVPGQLGEGMRSAVGQLQAAQVQAERQGAGAGEEPPAAEDAAAQPQEVASQEVASQEVASQEAGSPPSQPAPGAQQPPQPPPGQGTQRATDRLWIPGR